MFQKFDLAVLEGMPHGTGLTLEGRAQKGEFVPKETPGYVFRKELVRAFMAWSNPSFNPGNDGLLLSGPSGCGKTSFPNEVASRINMPVIEVTGHLNLELSDLVGLWIPSVNGTLVRKDGALTRALRIGAWFVLNEWEAVSPGVLIGLNEIAEKSEILIPETQELVRAEPGFRFFMTGNTSGMGDESGGFVGTMKQNIAFMDRFHRLEVDYMSSEDEIPLVEQNLSEIDDPAMRTDYASKMVEVANAIRDQFTGKTGGQRIEVTLSTRTLLRWARLSMAFHGFTRENGGKTNFERGMEQALTAGARPATRAAINGIIQRIIG